MQPDCKEFIPKILKKKQLRRLSEFLIQTWTYPEVQPKNQTKKPKNVLFKAPSINAIDLNRQHVLAFTKYMCGLT